MNRLKRKIAKHQKGQKTNDINVTRKENRKKEKPHYFKKKYLPEFARNTDVIKYGKVLH